MQDIKHIFKILGIEITDRQVNSLNKYYELLFERNKVMNLTAITDYDDVVIKHFADSAAIAHVMDLSSVSKIADVGTGAGFPGLVLKIVFPEISVVLLDSLNKRVKFLNDVISELNLTGVSAIHGRAEDLAHNNSFRENFDLVVARAVTNMSSLSEYCIPFVRMGGIFAAYKAADCNGEVSDSNNAIRILGGAPAEIKECNIPGSDIIRKFILIKKIKSTSARFPRKAGLPTKEPLL